MHETHFFGPPPPPISLFKPTLQPPPPVFKGRKMAQLRDEYGSPIQLTDEYGNPVELTDEHGNPVHITGIATKEPSTMETVIKSDVEVVPDTGLLANTTIDPDALKVEPAPASAPAAVVSSVGVVEGVEKTEVKVQSGEIQRSSSSSSGSSEDDGEGGRRKKKGLKQKLKEKLRIGKPHKDEQGQTATGATTTTPIATQGGGAAAEQQQQREHEKKSVMEKIKEKLPGHHNH